MTIGERIRQIRLRTGMDIPEAAAKAGINASYWWRLEHGEHDPGYQRLRKVAVALGCSLAELDGEEPTTPLTPLQKRVLGMLEVIPQGRLPDWLAYAGRLAAEDQEVAESFPFAMTQAAS